LQVRPDKGLTLMRNYQNLIPLDLMTARQIADALTDWPFETIYGGWWGWVIPSGAKQAMAASVGQYMKAVAGWGERF
jgi:hypothetical protein